MSIHIIRYKVKSDLEVKRSVPRQGACQQVFLTNVNALEKKADVRS